MKLRTNASSRFMGTKAGGGSSPRRVAYEVEYPRRCHHQGRQKGELRRLSCPTSSGLTYLGQAPNPKTSRAYTSGRRHQDHSLRQPLAPTLPLKCISTKCPTLTGEAKHGPLITIAISERSERTTRKRAQRATEPKASAAPRTKRAAKRSAATELRLSFAQSLIGFLTRCAGRGRG